MKNMIIKPNILYVDDNRTNLILFNETFRDEFNIFMADSGEKALELLGTDKFTAVISDQRMPGMSGMELMEIVQEKYSDVVRFIITAYSDYETVVDLINKGKIYGYFNKPYDSSEVRIVLKNAVEVYNLREVNRKMLTDLEKVNHELRAIDKSKTQFLNAISNEIRMPINKIMSALYILKDKIGSDELLELFNYLDSSVSKLESFSLTANKLVKLDDGIQSFNMTVISLNELIELSIIEKKNSLDEAGIILEIFNNKQDIMIQGELELLINCMTNLIANSLTHMERNGTMKILSGEDHETRYIEIHDQGKNNTAEQFENLKEFFSSNEISFDYMAGIEMLLVKKIMISHHGEVEIKLNADNTVSTRMVFPSIV